MILKQDYQNIHFIFFADATNISCGEDFSVEKKLKPKVLSEEQKR